MLKRKNDNNCIKHFKIYKINNYSPCKCKTKICWGNLSRIWDTFQSINLGTIMLNFKNKLPSNEFKMNKNLKYKIVDLIKKQYNLIMLTIFYTHYKV